MKMKKLNQYLKESLSDKEYIEYDEDKARKWLKNHIGEFSKIKSINIINNKVNIEGNVYLDNFKTESISELPFQFGVINGDFSAPWNISTLKGVPEEITGTFVCSCKNIKDLQYFPNKIGGDVKISCKELISLKGMPNEIGGGLDINNSPKLTNLKGCSSKINGWFDISFCDNLITLKGCPKTVGDLFRIKNCPSLTDIPNIMIRNINGDEKYFEVTNCKKLEIIGKINSESNNSEIKISNCPKLTQLPILPKICYNLELSGINIKDLSGCPKQVINSAIIKCKSLTSIQGIPQSVGNVLNVKGCINLSQSDKKFIENQIKYKKLTI